MIKTGISQVNGKIYSDILTALSPVTGRIESGIKTGISRVNGKIYSDILTALIRVYWPD